MRTANTNLSNEQAIKQLKQFAITGLALAAVGLLIFWWLGIAGLAFGARALVLSNHTANKRAEGTKKYRVFAVVGIVLGILDIALFNLSN